MCQQLGNDFKLKQYESVKGILLPLMGIRLCFLYSYPFIH